MCQRGRSKYGNIKTTTSDGNTHASIKEANRWCELKLLERAGKISNLQRQVEYELIPAQYEEYTTGEVYQRGEKKGQLKIKRRCVERSVVYVADAVYYENGKMIVEDTKSPATRKKESYIIKRKLLLWVYGIRLREA
jgi:hypothetical protein